MLSGGPGQQQQQAAASVTSPTALVGAAQQPYRPLRFSSSSVGEAEEAQLASPAVIASASMEATAAPAAAAAPASVLPAIARSDAVALEEEDDTGDMCVVCWANPRTHILVHRGGSDSHLCLCQACCEAWDYKSKGCPMCRQGVEYALKVF